MTYTPDCKMFSNLQAFSNNHQYIPTICNHFTTIRKQHFTTIYKIRILQQLKKHHFASILQKLVLPFTTITEIIEKTCADISYFRTISRIRPIGTLMEYQIIYPFVRPMSKIFYPTLT